MSHLGRCCRLKRREGDDAALLRLLVTPIALKLAAANHSPRI